MPLNPLKQSVDLQTLANITHPFQSEVDAALARFRTVRDSIKDQVRQGEITLKVAREKTVRAANDVRSTLNDKSKDPSPVPRVFLDRLVEASNSRRKAAQNQSLESLQRETNRLLRLNLVEQQIQARGAEFETKTYVRAIAGGAAGPTLESLLDFHEASTIAGDEPAREWARRHLEMMREQVIEPQDQRKIDLACDRPDQINQRLISAYVTAIRDRTPEELETFVNQSLESNDSNACAAAFVVARSLPDPTQYRWVRNLLSGLHQFPDQALNALRTWEAEARASEASTAQALATRAISAVEVDARLMDVEPPSEADLERLARDQSKPVANFDEPIGLAPKKRWGENVLPSEELTS